VKADKMPIGIFEDHRPFRNHSLYLGTDDTIYLFSDGYADQFGGPNDKKFKYKPFKETLVDIQPQNMTEQREVLYRVIEDWKGDRPQVDDIMVMGIRI
jgi:serine phosphatase RsbU (regulator of sigma subunit)